MSTVDNGLYEGIYCNPVQSYCYKMSLFAKCGGIHNSCYSFEESITFIFVFL